MEANEDKEGDKKTKKSFIINANVLVIVVVVVVDDDDDNSSSSSSSSSSSLCIHSFSFVSSLLPPNFFDTVPLFLFLFFTPEGKKRTHREQKTDLL